MKIQELVESYGVSLEKRGSLFVGFCPFHDDKNTPNLTVYPKTNSWYCFSCQIGGDMIHFVSLIEKVDRSEVQKRFAIETIKFKLDQLKQPKAIDFKQETNLLASALCREYLQKNRYKVEEVLKVLQQFDKKLGTVQELSYTSGMVMVEKLRKYLYNLK